MPLLKGEKIQYDLFSPHTNEKLLAKGKEIDEETFDKLPKECWAEIRVKDAAKDDKIRLILSNARAQIELLDNVYASKKEREFRTDDLQPGVIRAIKVYVAMKRRLSVGDKMAGRHGNKGVISKIIPVEEMPYNKEGMSVDIVLNPLGVPSRMNVGQVLETHLGLAAKGLGDKIAKMLEAAHPVKKIKKEIYDIYRSKFLEDYLESVSDEEVLNFAKKLKLGVHTSTPVFDGAHESEITRLLTSCGFEKTGQMELFDGRTGDRFEQPVSVGYLYMMKLHHLVDDKLHARSIGPYSLVTQQPLGGKAQFGGQRFGEMEVWALEGYGAAYTLREMLTIKSDDIQGRAATFDAIVKGETIRQPNIPASFNVLLSELKGLGLDVELRTVPTEPTEE